MLCITSFNKFVFCIYLQVYLHLPLFLFWKICLVYSLCFSFLLFISGEVLVVYLIHLGHVLTVIIPAWGLCKDFVFRDCVLLERHFKILSLFSVLVFPSIIGCLIWCLLGFICYIILFLLPWIWLKRRLWNSEKVNKKYNTVLTRLKTQQDG